MVNTKVKAKAKGLAALNKIAGEQTTTTRKSNTPICSVSEEMNNSMKEFKAAKADLDNATTRKLNAEMAMMDEAHRLRLEACKNSGKLHSSIKLAGSDTTLTFTQKSQCLKMDGNQEDSLRSIVGSDDDFNRYFQESGNYVLDEKALMNLPNADEVAEAIIAALGKHAHILTRQAVIVPT